MAFSTLSTHISCKCTDVTKTFKQRPWGKGYNPRRKNAKFIWSYWSLVFLWTEKAKVVTVTDFINMACIFVFVPLKNLWRYVYVSIFQTFIEMWVSVCLCVSEIWTNWRILDLMQDEFVEEFWYYRWLEYVDLSAIHLNLGLNRFLIGYRASIECKLQFYHSLICLHKFELILQILDISF